MVTSYFLSQSMLNFEAKYLGLQDAVDHAYIGVFYSGYTMDQLLVEFLKIIFVAKMCNDAVIICIVHPYTSADTGMCQYEMLKFVLSEGFIYKKIQMNLKTAFPLSCDRILVIIHNALLLLLYY